MLEESFEGSLVLEKLAEVNLVDEFYAAIDSDDIPKVIQLLRSAEVNEGLIKTLISQLVD